MIQFRRALRLVLFAIGIIAGIVTGLTAYFARMVINPPRQRLWATPADLGMKYEDIQFPASDGLRLSGWFIPIKETAGHRPLGATIILVHDWSWNRLGTPAENILTALPGSAPVQLIHLALALHRQGYQLFMFDLRNHGQSAADAPVTFGLREANDLLGALDYLSRRKDVAKDKIGVVGFSAGANATLFALPRTDLIKAAVLVQPASPKLYSYRYSRNLFGPLGTMVLPLAQLIYSSFSGLRLSAIEPIFAAAGAGATPVLFVQGTGDLWGGVDQIAEMVAHTPNAVPPLIIETSGRYAGFQYVVANPALIDEFLSEQMY